jgi:phage terminase small subunit
LKEIEVTEENLKSFLKQLPDDHRKFCLEYSLCWNAKAAYQKIHPKAKNTTAKSNGHKLLKDPKISSYLSYLGKQNAKVYQINKEDLIMDLIQVKQQSLAAVPVYGKDGKPTGDYLFNATGATQAIKMLGSEIGMFTNKLQVEDLTRNNIQAHIYVVPELRTIDMADPKFNKEITLAIQEHMNKRVK